MGKNMENRPRKEPASPRARGKIWLSESREAVCWMLSTIIPVTRLVRTYKSPSWTGNGSVKENSFPMSRTSRNSPARYRIRYLTPKKNLQ